MGGRLKGFDEGEGTPVVLLHGLTATRRYVVMGSRHLERNGHRVVAYDARGHGESAPADSYSYDALAADLLDVLDDRGLDRAVLVGASMGAHTIVRLALDHADRVAGLVIVTPAFTPDGIPADKIARYDRLAAGLRSAGVDGYVEAAGEPAVPEAWRDTVRRVQRQRLSGHRYPGAVADALEQVPRSRAFESWSELAAIGVPTVVVASRDEADPDHPHAVGVGYAQAIPGATVVTEQPGKSPLAWQGGQLSRVIEELAARAM